MLSVLLLLAAAGLQLGAQAATTEGNAKDIGGHGERDSGYYKWQRGKDGIQERQAAAKEKQAAAHEAAVQARTDSEKELIRLQKAMERKQQVRCGSG